MNPSKFVDNRVHKSPVTRQDSTALDISLSELGKLQNEPPNYAQTLAAHVNISGLDTSLVPTLSTNNKQQYGRQQHTPQEVDNKLPCDMFRQHPQAKIPKIGQPRLFHHENEIFSGRLMTDESSSHEESPDSMKLCRDQLMWEDTKYISKEHATQGCISVYVMEETCNQTCSDSDQNCAKQVGKSVKSCALDDANNLRINENAGYKSLENTESRKSPVFREGKGKTLRWASALSLETLLLYGACAVVILLAVVVMNLHMRLQVLETAGHVGSMTRCRCDKEQSALSDNPLPPGVDKRKASAADVYTESMLFADNLDDDAISTANADIFDLIPTDVKFSMFPKRPFNENTKKKIRSTHSDYRGASQSSKRYIRGANATGNSSKTENRTGKIDVTFTSAEDAANSFGTSVSVGEKHVALSRHVRSNQQPRKVVDKNLSKTLRRKMCRDFPKNCTTKQSKTRKGHMSQVDSFQGYFYGIFDFSTHLMQNECTSHGKWETGILACRNASIIIPRGNTVLPFYVETNKTAHKDPATRLIQASKTELGVFHVQKDGDYLIHVNITIVDHRGTNFLALHLNDQAVLACPNGGFWCPHSNQESSPRYRICNIIGLLELNTNDTLDIRTMEDNMSVRLEQQRISYFRVVRLN